MPFDLIRGMKKLYEELPLMRTDGQLVLQTMCRVYCNRTRYRAFKMSYSGLSYSLQSIISVVHSWFSLQKGLYRCHPLVQKKSAAVIAAPDGLSLRPEGC